MSKLKLTHCALILTIIITQTLLPCVNSSIISWLFGQKNADSHSAGGGNDRQHASAEIVAKSNAKFEMKTSDDTFLALAKDLSELDVCHHSVIAELTSSCSDLSEEELGKLAVQLLNCQSQAEGRQVFPCSQDMTIAECTGGMDPVTWNAYQIVSNRARAVCYATRQHQFRLKTEYTVNQLVHTTHEQLDAIGQIQKDHDHLSETTKTTLDQVKNSQEDFADRQQRLIQANKNVNAYVVGNIKELTKEKALIASGNRELAAMAEGLKNKLDEATEKILDQSSDQRHNHKEILEDLASIREKAMEVWEKIDNSSKDMMQYRDETKDHYLQTLANLQRINHTIAYLETTLHNTRAELESKLDWLLGLVGGTGDRVALISTLFLHAIYLILGAMSSAFLNTPRFSRLLLLALVPLNAWAQIHTRKSLGFLPMTLFIMLTVAANWALSWVWYLHARHRGKVMSPPPRVRALPKDGMGIQQMLGPVDTPHAMQSPAIRSEGQPQGLSAPDMHRLVNILENMYNSGILKGTPETPNVRSDNDDGPLKPLSITHLATPLNPPPTPCTTSVSSRRPMEQMSAVRRHLYNRLEDAPANSSPYKNDSPASSTPYKNNSPAPSLPGTPIRPNPEKQPPTPPATPKKGDEGEESFVFTPTAGTPKSRRKNAEMESSIIDTPRSTKGTPRGRRRDVDEDLSLMDTPKSTVGTPRSRRPQTPRTPMVSTPKTSRASTPNRTSASRALCLATTRNSMPCKLPSLDGSAFCHRHQVKG